MKVLSLIDSFKGTLSSLTLGKIMTETLQKRNIEASYIPISDGGEGFLDVISFIKNVKRINCSINDPLARLIKSYYVVDNDTAYIEMAESSGLGLLKDDEKNPFLTSTYGLGELINDAFNKGYKKIIVGIGGSATNDGGAGMLEALGVKFYNQNSEIKGLCNLKLKDIKSIDASEFNNKIKNLNITVLSDVINPLLGIKGATYVYSLQKGAKSNDLPLLEENMASYAKIVSQSIGFDASLYQGSGAAGGVGFAFHSFFKPTFVSGINYLLDLIDFNNLDVDVIITGEGKIDYQSLDGKVISGILKRVKNNQKVIGVCAIKEIEEIPNMKIYAIVDEVATVNESLLHPIETYKKLCEKVCIDLMRD